LKYILIFTSLWLLQVLRVKITLNQSVLLHLEVQDKLAMLI